MTHLNGVACLDERPILKGRGVEVPEAMTPTQNFSESSNDATVKPVWSMLLILNALALAAIPDAATAFLTCGSWAMAASLRMAFDDVDFETAGSVDG